MGSRSDIYKNGAHQPQVRNKTERHALRVKEKLEIADPAALGLVIDERDAALLTIFKMNRFLHFFIRENGYFLLQVASLQYGKGCDGLFRLLAVLPGSQRAGLIHDRPNLFRGHRRFFLRQRLCEGSLPLFLKSRLRLQDNQRAVRIVQKVLLDKRLEIACADELIQLLKDSELLQRVKGHLLVVEPGIKAVQSVIEALRIEAVIRFAEREFHRVKTGLQGFGADPVFHFLCQRVADDLQEAVSLRFLRILGGNRIIRL